MGGAQLTRAIGKAKAMDLILTGRTIDAAEADRSGLVSRVVPADTLLDEAKTVAATIAGMSLSASRMAKEAVNRAFESTLAEGLATSGLFHSAFATDDQTEGMNAFTESAPELQPSLKCTGDRHRRGNRRSASAGVAGQAPLVATALRSLARPLGCSSWGLDDAVAAATRAPVQGLVSGAAGAIGYALGVFAVWLVRYMRSKDSSPPAPRWAWLALVIGIFGTIGMIIWFHVWQDDVRDLMGVPRLKWHDYPVAAVLSIVVLFVLVEIGQLVGRADPLPGAPAQSGCAATGFGCCHGGSPARARGALLNGVVVIHHEGC